MKWWLHSLIFSLAASANGGEPSIPRVSFEEVWAEAVQIAAKKAATPRCRDAFRSEVAADADPRIALRSARFLTVPGEEIDRWVRPGTIMATNCANQGTIAVAPLRATFLGPRMTAHGILHEIAHALLCPRSTTGKVSPDEGEKIASRVARACVP